MKRMNKLLLVLVLLVSISACGKVQPTWQEQYDLGFRYLSEGSYEEAIIAFTAAIEIDPMEATTYISRGKAYVLSGETEENLNLAQADYEKALELDQTNVDAYLGLADVYICRGEYEEARRVLQEALERVGDNQSVLDALYSLNRVSANYVEDYKTTLSQYTPYRETPLGRQYAEYTLYDIDKNGIPELIVKPLDTMNYVFYTHDGTECISCGELWDSYLGTYAELYEYDGNGIVVLTGGMGFERIESAYVQQLVDDSLTTGETIASTMDMSYDEMYAILDGYTPINEYCHVDDYSILER